MNIVIFGANGKTGRLLTQRVLDKGNSAIAVTRNPADFPLSDPRLIVAKADVRAPSSLTEIVRNADVVLSALGVPFTRQRITTYSAGIRNITATMQETGVRRLIAVSSTGVQHYPHRKNAPLSLRLFEPIITRTIGKTAYDDLRHMENIMHASELNWTIVRPSGLFDLPATTDYIAGEVDPVGGFTARADLADYLAELAGDTSTIGKTVTISTTKDVPTMWQLIRREAFKGRTARARFSPLQV